MFIYKLKFDDFDSLYKVFEKHLSEFDEDQITRFTNQYIDNNR